MQKHFIVGTAGHIDHGKTTLSRALTGKDTDRLKEEKERSISIELGFAPFNLPNGDQVSLIDVPGHEKFIRHMVAGVGGIDLVLLVIAADEGVMPQTKEHLQIIELLGVEHGIVVITKKDAVDEEFLELVQEEVKEYIKDTTLKSAPLVSVSSINGEGITELKSSIEQELSKIEERSFSGFFRMPIDRVFSLKGIGTIITGTVYSGKVSIGDELVISPSTHPVRVRSLQVHDEGVNEAYAGQRVAINVTGIEKVEINRGDSIVTPNQWQPSTRVDVELRILKNLDFKLKHNSEIKFHIGTKEVSGTIILFDRKEAEPGDLLYCQFKLQEEIISSRKERFIIRRPSPSLTIGGGRIIEPNAIKHKYRNETIEQLKQKSKGTIADLLMDHLETNKQFLLSSTDLSNILILPEKDIENELHQLLEKNAIIKLQLSNQNYYISNNRLKLIEQEVNKHLLEYHQAFPLRFGQPKAEFIKQFFPYDKPKVLQVLLNTWQTNQFIKTNDEYVAQFEFEPSLPTSLQEKANKLEKKLREQRFTPDDWDELAKLFGLNDKEKNELYSYFINRGTLLKLTDKLMIHQEAFNDLKILITDFLQKEEKITLQEAKEILQVSRKYLVPLMELLDQEKITALRQGHNYRELRKK